MKRILAWISDIKNAMRVLEIMDKCGCGIERVTRDGLDKCDCWRIIPLLTAVIRRINESRR